MIPLARRSMGVLVAALVLTAPVGAQDSLAAARDLYSSAAYEDALAVLNRLGGQDRRADEARVVEQYRAFCLLALGRTEEASHAIEAVVAADPLYQPPTGEVPPRVRAMFSDARRKMLPSIVEDKYAKAKGAYDRKEFAAAADQFGEVLSVFNDPDLSTAAAQPPLSDLKTLAVGFHELAVKAAAPPPPPPAPAPTPAPAPPAAATPIPNHVYSADEPAVVLPVIIRQAIPPYPGQALPSNSGVIEIIVDETGAVESATMRASVTAVYDRLVLSAAKSWRYKPATLAGVPVKFRKDIQIAFTKDR